MRYKVKGSFNFIVEAETYEEAEEKAYKGISMPNSKWVIQKIKSKQKKVQ